MFIAQLRTISRVRFSAAGPCGRRPRENVSLLLVCFPGMPPTTESKHIFTFEFCRTERTSL